MANAVIGGRYRLKEFVDRGATARIYLAEDLARLEPVIVKLFAPEIARADETRALFHREAELLMSVNHPNIIKVLGHGESEGRPYLVTEPLRGESLDGYLARELRMPLECALTMMRHAALGLKAAHDAGIVHRDVKPGNLFLLGPLGSPYDLKVIDFGMAKRVAPDPSGEDDRIIGTVEYMAPELVVSDPADARTDVYALGVVLFRALTGHLPFDGDSALQLLAHQLFSPAPPPSWLEEGLDPGVDRMILRALRKRPDRRYGAMAELAADLERLRGRAPDEITALAPSPADDVYEPVTSFGREALRLLRDRVAGGR